MADYSTIEFPFALNYLIDFHRRQNLGNETSLSLLRGFNRPSR